MKATPSHTPSTGQPEQALGADQHASGGGDALAALEAQEYREEVAEEGCEACCWRRDSADSEARRETLGQPHREPALEGVADQREGGGELVAAAQHIGGARIAGAVGAGGRPCRRLG